MPRPRKAIPVSYRQELSQFLHSEKIDPERYVDVATLASRLRINKDSVRNMIEDHRLFALKIGRYVIDLNISERLLLDHTIWYDDSDKPDGYVCAEGGGP